MTERMCQKPATDHAGEANRRYYRILWTEQTVRYLAKSSANRWFNDLLGMILQKIDPRDIKTTADIGCGLGTKTAVMARYFTNARVTGFDFTTSAIEIAAKVHRLDNLSFSSEDITRLDLHRTYDVISAFDVLEHIHDWKDLLDKLIRANNKYMIISVPVGRMRPFEVHVGHYRNYQRNEMEQHMRSRGYKSIQVFYAGYPFYSPILRDLTNIFFKNYVEATQAEMSRLSIAFHNVWYFLFRYCSSKYRGDVFIGLFAKTEKGMG